MIGRRAAPVTAASAQHGGWVHPVYLVHTALDAARRPELGSALWHAVEDVLDDLRIQPEVAESVYVGVLVHHNAALVHRALRSPFEPTAPAGERWVYTVTYQSLLNAVDEVLGQDRVSLTESGIRSHRPVVVLVLDAPPGETDHWEDALHRLVVDADMADLGEDVPRAVLVTVSLSDDADPTAAALAYPPGVSGSYRVDDVDGLYHALRSLLGHLAVHAQAVADGDATALLPAVSDLPASTRVLRRPLFVDPPVPPLAARSLKAPDPEPLAPDRPEPVAEEWRT